MSENSTLMVEGCARCNDSHFVTFKIFINPIHIGEYLFTHWGLCPNTGEPILMRLKFEYEMGEKDE